MKALILFRFLFLILTTAVFAQDYDNTKVYAKVFVRGANLRSTPSIKGKRLLIPVYGDILEVIRRPGKWVKVKAEGRTGWVHGSTILIPLKPWVWSPRAECIYVDPKTNYRHAEYYRVCEPEPLQTPPKKN